ncbi:MULTISPECIES: glutathione S-transferase family protein [unclassified Bradyrhizobium]|uniref:glutathione S-transferase family protein n=1 Tax=unclassified Bradyrhizobium TaxID=2631580 RepID=UPI00042680BA|nr:MULTISPECIES: glutathione S-transferase family protein [unclassified Bradyrhizobium]QIG94296.1 glutathione S-transferase [Bradyrhizobium sp. 6(2017)]
MPRYRLHYFPESGNSYKLALMLTLCGETLEPVWTDFGGGIARTAKWRADVNAMGEIPVLEVDGERRTQTAPILLQLAEQYGKFGGETPEEKFELLRWLFWDNQKLSGYMATYRFMRTFTPSADPKVLKYFRARLDDFLGILDQHVGNNAFMIGARPTVSDISMMAYLHYPADETGYDFAASHPNISAWLSRIAALPGWKSAYDLLPGPRLKHYA